MAQVMHHHLHEVPLRRRLFRFVLVSVLVVTAVMLVQSVVMYLTMPRASKATHHARAACLSLGNWLDDDGPSGSEEAGPSLKKATDSAQSAAVLAPDRWSTLLGDLRAAAAPPTRVAGPGAVTPRDQGISSAMATCEPLLGKPAAQGS